ncbi:unnamed protein product [Sympodiomycopsis kandeliae]
MSTALTTTTHTNGDSAEAASTSAHPTAWCDAYSSNLPLNDALPYFDREIETHPGLQSRVERAIKDEMDRMKSEKQQQDVINAREARLPPNVEIFKDRPEMLAEIERAGRKEPLQSIDNARFRLPAPSGDLESTSEEEWKKAVENASIQLMHQEGRSTNIDLLKKYGANLWRLHNYQQEHFAVPYTNASADLQSEITSINRNRRSKQLDAGEQLSSLERKWTDLISRSLQLEIANISAEHEIRELETELDSLTKEVEAFDT